MMKIELPHSLSFADMKELYDGLHTLQSVAAGMSCQPRFTRDGNPTGAGQVIEQIHELIATAADEVARRAQAAMPSVSSESYSDDYADRTHVLVQQELSCEGVTETVNLVRRLYDQAGAA